MVFDVYISGDGINLDITFHDATKASDIVIADSLIHKSLNHK